MKSPLMTKFNSLFTQTILADWRFMLHEVKTTGTGLVWRTRPCGTEGTRHLKNPSFQYLTSLSDEPATIAKSYVEEKSIVQDLLQFQRRSN